MVGLVKIPPYHYVLNEKGEPVPVEDKKELLRWGQMFENQNRVVRQEQVGELFISTVFLGIDHGWGDGPPILWETMVFAAGKKAIDCDRCAGNREQAEAMHEVMVAKHSGAVERD